MEEAAERLRISRRYLQTLLRQHPYYRRVGRRNLMSEEDLRRLWNALPRPEPARVLPHRRLSRAAQATLDEALALTRQRRRR
jgi:excisionase family DNA binding protein